MTEKPDELLAAALKKFADENPEKLKEILKPKEGKKEDATEETDKGKEERKEKPEEKPYAVCVTCNRSLTRDQADSGSCPHCGGPDYTRIRYS